MKKTFTKHILLLALMLFGVAGAAWADRAPQKFTGPVAKSDLVVGDTLCEGVSITGDSWESVSFEPNRFETDFSGDYFYLSSNPSFGANGVITLSGNSTFTPKDENGNIGNAWVVLHVDGFILGGIRIAPDPTVPALDELTGNWNFLMPGSNKVVKAVLLDSIVVGPHVSVSFSDLAIEGKYANGTDTVYYYDTNSHPSLTLMAAANDGQGRNFGYWSDLDPTDPEYSSWYRYLSSGSFTCGDTFRAVYPDNHTLTLVTPQGGGTLSIDGVTYDTVYNITFGDVEHYVVPANEMPYTIGYSWCCGYEVSGHSLLDGNDKVEFINQGTTWVNIRVKGAFEGSVRYACDLEYEEEPYGDYERLITCTASIQPKMPFGITKTGDTYSVMEGLTVSVTATPDSAHYLSAIDDHDTVSNYACGYSFVMPDSDKDLLATFNDKPTLTLAQTDGGTLEAIVPEPAATAIVPPTDQMVGWESNHGDALMESDIPAAFGFVAVDQAAAEAWTGAPATGDALLIYGIEEQTFYYVSFHDGSLMGNSTAFFSPGSFYQMASAGNLYITTGIGTPNVIASSTPNTYYIDYGTPVTVVATPDAQHYLVRPTTASSPPSTSPPTSRPSPRSPSPPTMAAP